MPHLQTGTAKGKGIRATHDMGKGDVLCVYTGTIEDYEAAETHIIKRIRAAPRCNYALDGEGDKGEGGLGAFANHSCSPNAEYEAR